MAGLLDGLLDFLKPSGDVMGGINGWLDKPGNRLGLLYGSGQLLQGVQPGESSMASLGRAVSGYAQGSTIGRKADLEDQRERGWQGFLGGGTLPVAGGQQPMGMAGAGAQPGGPPAMGAAPAGGNATIANLSQMQRALAATMGREKGAEYLAKLLDGTNRYKIEGGRVYDLQAPGGPAPIREDRPLDKLPWDVTQGPDGKFMGAPGALDYETQRAGSLEAARANAGLPAKLAVAQAGAARNNISVVGPNEGAKTLYDLSAKGFIAAGDQVRQNRGTNALLAQYENALNQFQTGKMADARLSLGQLGREIGIKVDGVPEGELLASLGARLGVLAVPKGQGQVTEAERELFAKQVPQLSKTPEGNRLVINVMRRLNDYDEKVHQIYIASAQRHGGIPNPLEVQQAISQLGPPLPPAVVGALQAGPQQQGGNPAQPQPAAGGKLVKGADGVYRVAPSAPPPAAKPPPATAAPAAAAASPPAAPQPVPPSPLRMAPAAPARPAAGYWTGEASALPKPAFPAPPLPPGALQELLRATQPAERRGGFVKEIGPDGREIWRMQR